MNEITEQAIEHAMDAMFPHGAGNASHTRVLHHLEQIAQTAFTEGKTHALMGLMTTEDVAQEFGVTERRARALVQNRHERFGVGLRFGKSWLVHRDELAVLRPDAKYRP